MYNSAQFLLVIFYSHYENSMMWYLLCLSIANTYKSGDNDGRHSLTALGMTYRFGKKRKEISDSFTVRDGICIRMQ